MAPRTFFIINPTAGAGRAVSRWARFERELRKRGVPVEKVITQQPGQAVQIARAAAANYNLLAAVGGDGTVSEIADGIVASGARGTAIAIVPVGTGNDM